MVRQIFEEVGLDVDREVFSWMDGEFVFGLIRLNQGILVIIGVGGVMVFEISDCFVVEVILKKLNQMVSKNKGVIVKEKQMGEQLVMEWQMVGFGEFFGYGWFDDNVLFVVVGKLLIEVMMSMFEDGLIDSESFEEIVGFLLKLNQGYFYLDMEQVMVWVDCYLFVNLLMFRDVKVILDFICGIGVMGSWLDELINEMEMLLVLQEEEICRINIIKVKSKS